MYSSTLGASCFTDPVEKAALCLVAIALQSAPYLRKPFYETFLVTHQALAAVFLAFALRHTAKFWQTALIGFAATTWVIDVSDKTVLASFSDLFKCERSNQNN